MPHSSELPDCIYTTQPIYIYPKSPTPKHTLSLSNLDDQKFLRFSIKYLYLYKKAVCLESLKAALSRVLVDYYPLAGRLRVSGEGGGEKLEVDCNGEGAIFVEAFMAITAEEFLQCSARPNWSWRKLLYRVEGQNFFGVPPLIVQVTTLRCGAMILCTAINHCIADGIGSSQFLHAWAHFTTKPHSSQLSIPPIHSRHELRPRVPPRVTFQHREFTETATDGHALFDLTQLLLSQPLVPASATFTPSLILRLKKQCVPSLKCTSFEALASHVWRVWAMALNLPPFLKIKLLFSVNVRKRLKPALPEGFYGNGFVLACAEATVKELVTANLRHGVKLVREAKDMLDDDYLRSMVDLMEEKRPRPDLSASLVISQWSRLGLEGLDFGEGGPLHMGPLASEIYCLFLPVVGDPDATTVLMSVPESVVDKFDYYMKALTDGDEREYQNMEMVV